MNDRTESNASRSVFTPDAEADNDAPLRDDIRLLGRVLGDTLREQHGEAAFELIERTRQMAIRFRRDRDPAAKRELERMLGTLPYEEIIAVARAFTFFSQLANIAEDLHHNRRRRIHQREDSQPQEGSFALALERVREAGFGAEDIERLFARGRGDAGAHRASDRGAAACRPQPPARAHAPAARARPPAAHAGRARGERGGDPP